MPSFTTTINGVSHSWPLVINLGHVSAIQAAFPAFRIERVLLDKDPAYEMLCTDSTLLVHVLEVLIGPQVQSRGLTWSQFLESISGPVVDEIIKALLEAIGFFCPTRAAKARAELMVKMLTALQQADAASDTIRSGDLSGTALQSAESSPGGTASCS